MRLAHYGTFDVDNYGDLLFPKIIEWRLSDWEIQHISPTAGRARFKDAIIPREQPDDTMQAYVTGGGNIFNFRSTPLKEYAGVSREAYARLMIDPARKASRQGVPYLINSPSLSASKHTALERLILSQILKRADYVAFRDSYSVKEAQAQTRKTVHYVPDTALDVARMWPAVNSSDEANYIIVHANRRYGGTARETANAIDQIAMQLALDVLLLPIGPCHGDIDFMHELSKNLTCPHRCHEDYSLHEFAQKIAGARMYIGSSMHGFITALSYGRPCLLVLGQEIKQKFRGVLDICGLPETSIVESWQKVADQNCPTVEMTNIRRAQVFAHLDAHWDRFRAALDGDPEAMRVNVVPLVPLVHLAQRDIRLRAKLRRHFSRG